MYLQQFKTYAAGYETNPYGVKWLRFDTDGAPIEFLQFDARTARRKAPRVVDRPLGLL